MQEKPLKQDVGWLYFMRLQHVDLLYGIKVEMSIRNMDFAKPKAYEIQMHNFIIFSK